jgi:hypothetical protein
VLTPTDFEASEVPPRVSALGNPVWRIIGEGGSTLAAAGRWTSSREHSAEGVGAMTTWTTALEARVKVDEELQGAFMTALAAAFAEPKPGLALGSGRLVVRLEVEADREPEAARLAAERFARALEKATQDLLPRFERLEPGGVPLPIRPPSTI